MQITAAVLRAADGPYALESVELADPLADEVLVRIVAAGMCHTDVLPRAEVTFSPPPIITGHEGAGVVEAVGADVTGIAVGDHVVLSFDSCGACAACTAGAPAHCETFLLRNLLGRRLDFTTGVTDADGAEVASRWFGDAKVAALIELGATKLWDGQLGPMSWVTLADPEATSSASPSHGNPLTATSTGCHHGRHDRRADAHRSHQGPALGRARQP